MKTVAADGNVHISASDDFDSGISSDALGKVGIPEANLANGSDLNNTLGHGNEIQDVVERLPLKRSVQSGNDHDLAAVCQSIANLNNVRKELTFVNGDDTEGRHHVLQLAQGAGGDGLDAACFAVQLRAVVCASHFLVRVAIVPGKLNNEAALVGMLVSLDASLQLSRLACKHGAQYQLDVAALHAAEGRRAPRQGRQGAVKVAHKIHSTASSRRISSLKTGQGRKREALGRLCGGRVACKGARRTCRWRFRMRAGSSKHIDEELKMFEFFNSRREGGREGEEATSQRGRGCSEPLNQNTISVHIGDVI